MMALCLLKIECELGNKFGKNYTFRRSFFDVHVVRQAAKSGDVMRSLRVLGSRTW